MIFISLVLIAGFFVSARVTKFNFVASLLGRANTPGLLQTEATDFAEEEPPPSFQLAENLGAEASASSAPQQLSSEEIQNKLDDIAEKIDVINQQVLELQGASEQAPEQNPNSQNQEDENSLLKARCAAETSVSFECSALKTQEESMQEKDSNQENNKESSNQIRSAGVSIAYPKVLISEVQVSGASDDKEEFVELYNSNPTSIDLTGWYLQRKTAGGFGWSSYASKNLFSGKTISNSGYFLIAREGYFSAIADVSTNNPITDDNSFALKNPNGEISDKLGFGLAQDFELLTAVSPEAGRSIGRKWINNSEQDTDNNLVDFELQTPTPKTQNIKYETSLFEVTTPENTPIIMPEIPALETTSTEDLKPIVINEIQIAPIEQRFIELYNPNDSDIDLTGWYLQRKTKTADSWNSFASSTNFEGKTIPSGGYFIISRELQNSDILIDITLSGDNSLIIKNPQREIVDKIGWGEASDCEGVCASTPEDGQSIGRINGADTNNNGADFAVFPIPTPKSANVIAPSSTGSSDLF